MSPAATVLVVGVVVAPGALALEAEDAVGLAALEVGLFVPTEAEPRLVAPELVPLAAAGALSAGLPALGTLGRPVAVPVCVSEPHAALIHSDAATRCHP